MKRLMHKILAVLIAISVIGIAIFANSSTAHAVGGEQECFAGTAYVSQGTGDSNDLNGQVFTASGSYNVGAVKINLYQDPGVPATIINVYLTDTLFGGGVYAPDMNNILATQQLDMTTLDIWDGVTPTNNSFSCDPLVLPAQVVEFATPVAVTGGVRYAIVIDYDSGSVSGNLWVQVLSDLADGTNFGFDCNVPTACGRLIPGTWDLFSGAKPAPYAVFDSIVTVTPSGTADTWLNNFLRDFLGFDSDVGELILGFGFSLVIIFGLLMRGVHILPTMAFAGFSLATATLALLVPIEVFLAMFALLGVSVLIGAVMLGGSSSEEG